MKKLILVDPNAELCSEWRKHFDGLPGVEVVNDRFENLKQFDCMVSAANSFGLMDGGVDLAIISYFGIELMDRVQAMVLDRFLGEQPIGTSVMVETNHPRHPYIAHTPTMRVPMSIVSTSTVLELLFADVHWGQSVVRFPVIEFRQLVSLKTACTIPGDSIWMVALTGGVQ